jgi:CheY-like chemotaxis protein
MDGFEVMAALKAIETEDYLPVLVITARPSHKQQALQSGAMDFISKPFELSEVLVRVRNMLEMRLMHLEAKRQINTLEQKVREIERSRELLQIRNDDARKPSEIMGSLTKTTTTESIQPHVPRAARHHILLTIEDNPADMKLVEQILARHPDMRMLSAVNGNSGIQLARELLPDVILVDINLPDISGFKTLEILRADPATTHIPVIAISINAATETIESGLKAGFFRYVTKPIKVDELMQALEVALENADHRNSQIA